MARKRAMSNDREEEERETKKRWSEKGKRDSPLTLGRREEEREEEWMFYMKEMR
jgi:hypothetical protein